ncbi:ABC transporter ATP-binding protein [Candidatus Dojkabacteria bacterium]|nr:ABC transporter ATP-binding protein [Candidatus Dojkabacteria bacterium]
MEKKKNEEKKTPNLLRLLVFIYEKYYKKNEYTWQIWAYTVLQFLTRIYPLVYNFVLAKIIDEITQIYNKGIGFESLIPIMITWIVLTLLGILANNFYRYVDSLRAIWRAHLEDRVYLQKYLEIEPKAYENPEFVNMKNTLSWNSWDISGSIYDSMNILSLLPVIIISFISISSLVPSFALLGILASIPSALIVKHFGKRVWNIWGDKGEEKIKYASYRGTFWSTQFEKMQEAFVFKYGKYLVQKADDLNKRFSQKLQNNVKKRYGWSIIADLFSWALTIFVLVYSVKLVFNGQLTVGMLTFVLATYAKFSSDIGEVLYIISSITGNRKIIETFYNLQNWKNTQVSGDVLLKNVDKGVSIEFKDVWFKYDRSKNWVLKNINFSVKADEDIAVVGKNGAGKSTLIKLLLRIYDPQKGQILINGVDIKKLNLDEYYKLVGILSQTFNKFNISASDNIFIGDITNLNKEDIVTAAKKSDIHSTIEKLPKKYDTFISREIKDGTELSGGEWQKLAMARAFFRDAKFLILDEPTSAVDSISEEKIFENFRENSKHKTTLIVSHRFATVRNANRILVIDQGKIVEDGPHKELMKQKGLYSEMYSKQVGQNSSK